MTNKELYSYVDHTQLKAFATWNDIVKLCDEAVKYETASVCVPPCYIKRIHDKYGENFNICTVIGFPLGYSVTESKVVEAKKAIEDGANEVDMVINISDVKNGDFDKVLEEIKTIKAACGEKILKVIIETCYLTDEEKIKLCQIVTEAKAEYIKTSTGFGTNGATYDDVKLFADNVGKDVKIKAAGGIRTREDMDKFIELGASRLGTSSAISILEN
ncbi:MAG: deoxyribose-phosphate aldolase [Lachnospiraceae bacterium]|nr:deoxyribose-phosphate aldolase [Lachnospiraceae bacterium]